jgi:N-acetylmuramoyl-L-alanine amidase
MEIINNRLNESVIEKIVRNPAAQANIGGNIIPKFLIIHYTATDSAKSAINTFKDPSNKNRPSAHIVLDKDGTITQMVDFNRRANHAGFSKWDGNSLFNNLAIGIEIVNAGFAEKLPDGSFRRNNGTPQKPSIQTWPAGTPAMKIDHKHIFNAGKEMHNWFTYPQPQLDALYKLCKLIVQTCNIKTAIGHDDISAGRKLDPGPAFPWDIFKTNVFGQTDNNGKIFKVNKNNNVTELKKEASAVAPLLKKLKDGYEVGLIKTDGEWSKVYLANKVDEVVSGKVNVKTDGWILSNLLTLKEGQ